MADSVEGTELSDPSGFSDWDLCRSYQTYFAIYWNQGSRYGVRAYARLAGGLLHEEIRARGLDPEKVRPADLSYKAPAGRG